MAMVDRMETTIRRKSLGMVDRMETTVQQKSLGVVDRVEPMFQEHTASMANREASVVRMERVVLLEVENEVGHDDEDYEDSGKAGSW
jgi:predicted protein tyrosine phosphatase